MKRTLLVLITFTTVLLSGCLNQDYFENIFLSAVSHEVIDEEVLHRLNREQLRVIRNAIYASYGRPFSSIELNYLFYLGDLPIFGQTFDVNEDYSDELLTSNDTANAETILLVEKDKANRFEKKDPRVEFFLYTYSMSDIESYVLVAEIEHPETGEAAEMRILYLFESPPDYGRDYVTIVSIVDGEIYQVIRNNDEFKNFYESTPYRVLKDGVPDIPYLISYTLKKVDPYRIIDELDGYGISVYSGSYRFPQ